MDIFLPRISGIECTTRLKERFPDLQIVMFTSMEDHELLFMSLEAGADGYLLKRTKPAELRNAIFEVLSGGAPMSAQIARRLIESFRSKSKSNSECLTLSTREDQILQLVAKGHSNGLISRKLDIAVETVSSHLERVFKKLHVRSRTEAAVRYIGSKPSQQRLDDGETLSQCSVLRLTDRDHTPPATVPTTSTGYAY
jgi:DNA-binding NarL/FixJ family response regulator